MAEEFGDKTHEATPHRRQMACEEGQVVNSQDLASAALLVAAVLILGYFGNAMAESMGRVTREYLGGAAWLRADAQDFSNRSLHLTWELGKALVPVLGLGGSRIARSTSPPTPYRLEHDLSLPRSAMKTNSQQVATRHESTDTGSVGI